MSPRDPDSRWPVIRVAEAPIADPAKPTRRDFIKLTTATMALAGLGACSRTPQEKIVPSVQGQIGRVTGLPTYFATAVPHAGYANGVLVQTHDGRPTKVEGNPRHPASLGGTDIHTQAAVLDLWDPNRSQAVLEHGGIASWESFGEMLSARVAALDGAQGRGLFVLTRTVTSPTLAAQIEALRTRMPAMRWHAYEPFDRGNVFAGTTLAYGEPLEPRYAFQSADTIVSLDADFLSTMPGSVRYARDYASRRAVDAINRLYVFEPATTITGSRADHRFKAKASQMEDIARVLAGALGIDAGATASPPVDPATLRTIAEDLRPGRSIVVAGDRQAPIVHALAAAINDRLGNVGHTVGYSEPVAASTSAGSLADLVAALSRDEVHTLLIIEGNPVRDAPADLRFGDALRRAKAVVHLGLYVDETAKASTWHVPQAHAFESWSDVRAYDGTVSIVQPLIAPLYGGRSAHELLSLFPGPRQSGHEAVRAHWSGMTGRAGRSFETWWKQTLHDGVLPDTRLPDRRVRMARTDWTSTAREPVDARGTAVEVGFSLDPSVWDGRQAANGWLQELPRPITKLTWDNVVLMDAALASRLDVDNGQHVELRHDDRSIVGPACIEEGHVADAVTVHAGYGSPQPINEGRPIGFDIHPLRTSTTAGFATGVVIRKVDGRTALSSTQGHHRMEGRDIARSVALEDLVHAKQAVRSELPSLYPPVAYDGYRWGMAIDLNACIGCSACTIACQAENNIPIVGKEEVARGRAMHWIRVDHYVDRDERGDERTQVQPVPCMQCENAPCEVVCPVEASVHDDEGINVQVYNRCIGTRFCSNNCPYKVRRFNWFQYSSDDPAIEAQKNPEVTVRNRGVMEKCNYCLQRITIGRIEAEKQGRRIRDGEVVSACMAACPTGAIVFGDLNDPASRVNHAKADPRDYALLEELNTRPRTTYGARVTNPNPALAPAPDPALAPRDPRRG